MKQKTLAIIGLAHIFIPLESYASPGYDPNDPKADYCFSASSDSNVDTITIDTIVIPPGHGEEYTFWRRPEQSFRFSCSHRGEAFEPMIYLNTFSIAESPFVEMGIIINGRDYYPHRTPADKKVRTGRWIRPQDGQVINNINEFKFTFFLRKRAHTNPEYNKPIELPSRFTALWIGRDDGVLDNKYRIDIVGMNNISQLPCASTVSIIPSTIDFGSISSSDAHADKEIKRIPFSIVDQRTCEKPTPYSLKGYLRPLDNSAVIDSRYTLVPLDNYSVGINIFETEGNKSVLFNEEFEISPKVNLPIYIKPFEARLKWRTSTPKFGKFNAGAILDIDYK